MSASLAGTTSVSVTPVTEIGFGSGSESPTGGSGSSLTSSSSLPTPSESAQPTTQSLPTRTLVAVCVAAGILLGGLIIFVLWWDRSKKKAAGQRPGEENYSPNAQTQDVKLRGVHAAPAPPILSSSLGHNSIGTTAYDYGYQGGKGGYDYDAKQSFEAALLPARGPSHTAEYAFPAKADVAHPQTVSPSPSLQSVSPSPRSASAQPITHPYSVGAHPYANPALSRSPLYRPSFERTATSTTAIAAEPSAVAVAVASPFGFSGAGTRPGYDAYGVELRSASATGSNHIGSRPSIESIRSLARKASLPNVRNEPTSARPRTNSTSTYAGSVRGGKVKTTKEEKARELAAMDHLIAALDENAQAEKRRKEGLVAAAGIVDNLPASSKDGGTSRRKDTAITGSYPLPPPEVFRAALSGARADDEPDDAEIERWKRH